jgi:hypothetical protein
VTFTSDLSDDVEVDKKKNKKKCHNVRQVENPPFTKKIYLISKNSKQKFHDLSY